MLHFVTRPNNMKFYVNVCHNNVLSRPSMSIAPVFRRKLRHKSRRVPSACIGIGHCTTFSLISILSEIIKLCKAMSDFGSTMLYHKTNMGVGLRVAEQLSEISEKKLLLSVYCSDYFNTWRLYLVNKEHTFGQPRAAEGVPGQKEEKCCILKHCSLESCKS